MGTDNEHLNSIDGNTTASVDLAEQQLSLLKTWGKPGAYDGPVTLRPRSLYQLNCVGPGRTQQSFKDECDINRIMAKFRKTGELTHLNKRDPQYGDFSDAPSYQDAANRVLAAQNDFNALSSRIRARMDNDPATFLAFMADPNNEAEAIELGLLPAPEVAPDRPATTGATASEPEVPSPQPPE